MRLAGRFVVNRLLTMAFILHLGCAAGMEFLDFLVTQGAVEQLKFVKPTAEVSDQERGGVRSTACIPVAQFGWAEAEGRLQPQRLAGDRGAVA